MRVIDVDYTVIGAGAAGLSCAIEASRTGEVALVTKVDFPGGNTVLAQGGIAVALGENDRTELHARDTVLAGDGVCNGEAVGLLVEEGVERVRALLSMGFPFDRGSEGRPKLSREGAHTVPRVISSGGDNSGLALGTTLAAEARKCRNITVFEKVFAVELLVNEGGCYGVLGLDLCSGEKIIFLSRATVLATGGCGQVYSRTTNAGECTGDGFALAYRAGTVIENMEFVQFHPTALLSEENPVFLVSEAVRGEGAVLLNNRGERFMYRHHPWAELAPRDVVARGIYAEMRRGNTVFLDAGPLGDGFGKRFPAICQACRQQGLTPPDDLIPVAPAAHFIMGGVKCDLDGRTGVKGLYACGEVACTGVHGANRLASNSLLEGLVFGYRVGQAVAEEGEKPQGGCSRSGPEKELSRLWPRDEITDRGICRAEVQKALVKELKELMWRDAGVVRCHRGLSRAAARIKEMESAPEAADIQVKNMLTTAKLIVEGALARKESCGSHFRSDYSDNVEDNSTGFSRACSL